MKTVAEDHWPLPFCSTTVDQAGAGAAADARSHPGAK
jgi:hypothetical protein